MRRAALVLLLLLLGAGEALAQAGGPCLRCHLGRLRLEAGPALGQSSPGTPAWQVEPCPALALLRRQQAGLEERMDLLASSLPGLARRHYPLYQAQAGLAQARAQLNQALNRPLASLEEAQAWLNAVDQTLQEQVEQPWRGHEQRLARLQGLGWLALGLLLAGLAWLWGWRRLHCPPSPFPGPAAPPQEQP